MAKEHFNEDEIKLKNKIGSLIKGGEKGGLLECASGTHKILRDAINYVLIHCCPDSASSGGNCGSDDCENCANKQIQDYLDSKEAKLTATEAIAARRKNDTEKEKEKVTSKL